MPTRSRLALARWFAAWLTLVGLVLAVPRAADAAKWVEVRVIRDDVRLEFEKDGAGRARVEHRVVFLVSGGPLDALTLHGVDGDAAPEVETQAVSRQNADAGSVEGAVPATVKRTEPASGESDPAARGRADLEVTFDGGAGLRRGAYVLYVRYETDLARSGLLTGDGATRTLSWQGLVWDDGLDTTKATIVVPTSPTEPAVVEPLPDGDDAAPVFLANVQRTRDVDELAIVKPYAPRGEPVVWTARVDARAIGATVAPPPSAAPREPRVSADDPLVAALRSVGLERLAPRPQTLAWLAAAIGAAVWSLLIAAKASQTRRSHQAARARARPLIPLPTILRAPLSAAAVVAGVGLQLTRPTPTEGAALLAFAALLAAHRAPAFKVPPRAPGRWLPVSPTEAFAPPPAPVGLWLDAGTRVGGLLFFALLAGALGLGSWFVSIGRIDRGLLIALDAAILFPLFLTGRVADLPPDPAIAPAKLLRGVARRVPRLVGSEAVRAVPRIRVPQGGADPDDLRLSFALTRPLQGLRSVAVGVSYGLGAFGWVGLPEILVRVVVGSPADRALAPVAGRARAMQGNKADERVLAFVPRLPTAEITATLAAAVLSRLVTPAGAEAPPRAAATSEAARKAA